MRDGENVYTYYSNIEKCPEPDLMVIHFCRCGNQLSAIPDASQKFVEKDEMEKPVCYATLESRFCKKCGRRDEYVNYFG